MGSVDGGEMSKYGVVLDEEKAKTASDSTHCPKCGRELSKMEVLERNCANCGTEPFEKKP
jgi:ribosomal protein S27AE